MSKAKVVGRANLSRTSSSVVDRAARSSARRPSLRWQNRRREFVKPSKYIDLMILAAPHDHRAGISIRPLRVRAAQTGSGRGATLWPRATSRASPSQTADLRACARSSSSTGTYARPPCGGADGGLLRARPRETALRTIEGLGTRWASHRARRYRRGPFLA